MALRAVWQFSDWAAQLYYTESMD